MQITGASPWAEVLRPRREQALQAVLTCIRLRDRAIEPRFQELVIEIVELLDHAPGLIGWSMADADAHVHLTLRLGSTTDHLRRSCANARTSTS